MFDGKYILLVTIYKILWYSGSYRFKTPTIMWHCFKVCADTSHPQYLIRK